MTYFPAMCSSITVISSSLKDSIEGQWPYEKGRLWDPAIIRGLRARGQRSFRYASPRMISKFGQLNAFPSLVACLRSLGLYEASTAAPCTPCLPCQPLQQIKQQVRCRTAYSYFARAISARSRDKRLWRARGSGVSLQLQAISIICIKSMAAKASYGQTKRTTRSHVCDFGTVSQVHPCITSHGDTRWLQR